MVFLFELNANQTINILSDLSPRASFQMCDTQSHSVRDCMYLYSSIAIAQPATAPLEEEHSAHNKRNCLQVCWSKQRVLDHGVPSGGSDCVQ